MLPAAQGSEIRLREWDLAMLNHSYSEVELAARPEQRPQHKAKPLYIRTAHNAYVKIAIYCPACRCIEWLL